MISKRLGKELVSKRETDAQGVTRYRTFWVTPRPWKDGQAVLWEDYCGVSEFHFTFRPRP